jgi:FtsH-binding integral membrane protein
MSAPDARRSDSETQGDLIETLPVVGRATTQFERSFGPSCLLSLVIVLLLTLLVKRYVGLSWTSLGCLTGVVWFLVLMLLIRWRPDQIVDEE